MKTVMKTAWKKKNLFVSLLAFLLALRDYIFIFDENLSPVISIAVYAVLFAYLYLDIITRQWLTMPKKLAITVLLILLTVLCHFSSYPILTIFLFVYVLRNTSLEDAVSIFFWPRFIMTILATLLYELGMTNDVARDVGYKLGGGTFHTMGMSMNPNTTASYYFCAIMLCYLYGKIRNKKILFFVPVITAVYITKVTMSRTVLLSTIALYIFDLVFRSKKNNVMVKASLLLPFVYIVLTLYLAFLGHGNPVLNVLFSLRPAYWFDYFAQLGIKDFIIGSGSTLGVTVDSGYIGLLIYGGLFLYLPFLKLLKNGMVRNRWNESPYFSFLLTIFSFSFMESVGMMQLRDITVLLYLVLYKLMLNNSYRLSSNRGKFFC